MITEQDIAYRSTAERRYKSNGQYADIIEAALSGMDHSRISENQDRSNFDNGKQGFHFDKRSASKAQPASLRLIVA
jgi:hypothetical protein